MSHMSRRTAHQSGLSLLLLLLLLLWYIVLFIDLGEMQTPLHWLTRNCGSQPSLPFRQSSRLPTVPLTLQAFVFFLQYSIFY